MIERPGGFMAFETMIGIPGLRHVVTTRVSCAGPRAEGSLGLRTGDDPADALASRRRAAEAIGADAARLVVPAQAHTATVALATAEDAGRGALDRDSAIPETDAVITREAGLPLLVQSADCPLVLLHDADRGALGVVHAGWRGTFAGIARRAVEAMRVRLGCDPASLRAGVAPSIGPCCYAVGPDLVARLDRDCPAGRSWLSHRGDGLVLDLGGLLVDRLEEAGVRRERIEVARLCTRCRGDLFYSYRRDGTESGRFGLLAMLGGST
jgi:YfiH family protein